MNEVNSMAQNWGFLITLVILTKKIKEKLRIQKYTRMLF
jgi:hypothetical protein